ncbi:MAG: ATP-binding protein [Dongiaceae bacterium]
MDPIRAVPVDLGAAFPAAVLSDKLLAAVVDSCPISVAVADPFAPDMPLLYVNDAFVATTGYAREAALGRNCRFLQGPETDPAAVAALRAAIAERRPITVDLLNYRRDGTAFWNQLAVAPVHDAAGRLTAFLALQRDVTEDRRRAAAAQRRSAMEATGRLAAGLAHEIHNLVQPVITLTDLALERGDLDPALREHLGIVRDSGRRARELMRDVLSFARPEPAAVPGAVVAPALRRAVAMARATLGGRRLECDIPELPDRIRAEAAAIERVALNLIGNARDATAADGTIAIGLQAMDGPDGRRLLLAVADDGVGMDAATRARAFEPFFSTRLRRGGTGLGLAIVRELVESWGGSIAVQSAPGSGTRMELSLPVLPASKGEAIG